MCVSYHIYRKVRVKNQTRLHMKYMFLWIRSCSITSHRATTWLMQGHRYGEDVNSRSDIHTHAPIPLSLSLYIYIYMYSYIHVLIFRRYGVLLSDTANDNDNNLISFHHWDANEEYLPSITLE